MQNLNDPRNNLPFSAMFMGLVIGTDYSTGSLRIQNQNGPVFNAPFQRPVTNLVRGGMMELVQSREGGPFACYFMINPDSIAFVNAVNSNALSPPSETDPEQTANSTWLMTSQSVSFTLWFNRQYEVWTNQVPSAGTYSPGPSAIGVRYDIRALERLLGMYDMASPPGSANVAPGPIGSSINSPQQSVAQANPLQISCGGPNSLQFQGKISEVDYTYTKSTRTWSRWNAASTSPLASSPSRTPTCRKPAQRRIQIVALLSCRPR
jgi:hypothetical protein